MKMKNIVLTLLVLGLLTIGHSANAATRVRGYYKKNGTYVGSYYKSSSNYSKFDNYSSWGNYNPYSGKRGYKKW